MHWITAPAVPFRPRPARTASDGAPNRRGDGGEPANRVGRPLDAAPQAMVPLDEMTLETPNDGRFPEPDTPADDGVLRLRRVDRI